MSTRISDFGRAGFLPALLLALVLPGCRAREERPPADLPSVPCAHAGAPLAPACTYDREGSTILIRHPDGAFRRFRLANGVLSTDGAQPPRISRKGNSMLVEVGGDRYQLPAR